VTTVDAVAVHGEADQGRVGRGGGGAVVILVVQTLR
jgi:hypothetical protein